jgi:hypothetical protein
MRPKEDKWLQVLKRYLIQKKDNQVCWIAKVFKYFFILDFDYICSLMATHTGERDLPIKCPSIIMLCPPGKRTVDQRSQ